MALTFLVTGASGFTGRALCHYLREQGYEVREATRASTFTLAPDADFSPWLKGVDVVVHLAAKVHVLHAGKGDEAAFERENVQATRALAQQAAQAGVRRFVFISTIGVHGNSAAAPVHEQSPICPAGGYGASKWRAEEALRALSGIETVILRPPLIYGAGVKANFAALLNAVSRGWWLPFGALHHKRDYLSLRNFCSAVAYCALSPNAAGQCFVLRDGEPISTAELVRAIAAAMNKRAKLLPIAPLLLKLSAKCLGKSALYASVCGARIIDDTALRRLGWKPEQSFEEGLRETVKGMKS